MERAVGYVRGEDARGQRDAIRRACEERGWELARCIGEPGPGRGRRAEALEVAATAGTALAVARLDALAGSLGELAGVLGWLERAGVPLVSLEPELDTSGRAGRAAAKIAARLLDWDRGMRAELAREARATARAGGRPAGPPAVADDPELLARIRALRSQGLSLRALADRLNAEGVPTPRGGSRWRASSVQAALGYRRPPPPHPHGGPPLPPHPPPPDPARRRRPGPPPKRRPRA
jgi:DNA invertase Pin-like site-specific DNA recombinase